jgi:ABC-type transport system substrate-binding protein
MAAMEMPLNGPGRRRLGATLGVSRRQMLSSAVRAAGGGAALALTACRRTAGGGQAGTSGAAAPAGPPARGGYLRHLVTFSAGNIDPHLTEDVLGYGFIEMDWYEPLVRIDYTPVPDWRIAYRVIPWLCGSFEQVDPTTYTFKIRPGVTFHNGGALTAEDVVFSFNRIRDPSLKANPQVAAFLANLDTIVASDDATVRMTTKRPDADFMSSIAGRNPVIVPKKYLENGGDLTKTAVGTGPFKLTGYQKDGNATAARYPEYWLQGRPNLDGLAIALKVDNSTISAAFAAGEADIWVGHDRREADPILKANPKAVSEPYLLDEVFGLMFNLSKPPFSDLRLRRALHLILDRQDAIKAVNFGDGLVSGPIVVQGKTGWSWPQDQLLKEPGFRQPKDEDIAEARRLMAAAGFPNGLQTSLVFLSVNASAPQYAEVIQAQLKQLGVDATLVPADNAAFVQRRVKSDYELLIAGEASLATPGVAAATVFRSNGIYAKPAGISDSDLDRLIDAQSTEFDFGKRGALFQQIERRILDQVYKAPISTPKSLQLSQPWVHDWAGNRSAIQVIMNPDAIWMSLDKAPANRRRAS